MEGSSPQKETDTLGMEEQSDIGETTDDSGVCSSRSSSFSSVTSETEGNQQMPGPQTDERSDGRNTGTAQTKVLPQNIDGMSDDSGVCSSSSSSPSSVTIETEGNDPNLTSGSTTRKSHLIPELGGVHVQDGPGRLRSLPPFRNGKKHNNHTGPRTHTAQREAISLEVDQRSVNGHGSSISPSCNYGISDKEAVTTGQGLTSQSCDRNKESTKNPQKSSAVTKTPQNCLERQRDNSTITLEKQESPNCTPQARQAEKVKNPQFDIYVRDYYGKSHPITVRGSDKVTQLKKQVHERTRITTDQQWLTYEGKPLQDFETLRTYNVTANSTIYLHGRQRGGAEW